MTRLAVVFKLRSQNSITCSNVLLVTHFLGGGAGQPAGRRKKKCDVAIVGGGIAGLYTAETLLRKGKETNVCIFERETRLGGRLYDHVFPQVPDESVGQSTIFCCPHFISSFFSFL